MFAHAGVTRESVSVRLPSALDPSPGRQDLPVPARSSSARLAASVTTTPLPAARVRISAAKASNSSARQPRMPHASGRRSRSMV